MSDYVNDVAKRILNEYLETIGKGVAKSIDEYVDEAVVQFRRDLIKVLNGFDIKKEGTPKIEYMVCPVDAKTKVSVFRNVCQDWQSIPECFHGLCGLFPTMDKVPVTNVDLVPKKKEEDSVTVKESSINDIDSVLVEGNKLKIGNDEIEVKGESMFEKVRYLRDNFLDRFGAKRLRQIVRKLFGKESSVSVEDSQVVFVEWVDSDGVVKQGNVVDMKKYDDGSKLLIVKVGNETKLVLENRLRKIWTE